MAKSYIARNVDGILLLDKPEGISSNTALQIAKRLFRAKRAGHTGTLDPMATGLLPVCFGEATKFGGSLLESDKAYLATLKLGEVTDTGDALGQLIRSRPVFIRESDLDAALARYRGTIEQVPPMYSALKRDGKPLYKLARQGIVVERSARTVHIRKLELLEFQEDHVKLLVECSKGTYVRTLAEDIGEDLGCGAHLVALRRVAAGDFGIDQSHSIPSLEQMTEAARDELLLPVDSCVRSWPKASLSKSLAERFLHGQTVSLEDWPAFWLGKTAVYDEVDRFLGTGNRDEEGKLCPQRLLSQGVSSAG